jgi:hypothetical protein
MPAPRPPIRTVTMDEPRSTAYGIAAAPVSCTGMIPADEVERGVYLHRDDVADMIRRMGTNGAKDLPVLATAVPAYVAEQIRLLP